MQIFNWTGTRELSHVVWVSTFTQKLRSTFLLCKLYKISKVRYLVTYIFIANQYPADSKSDLVSLPLGFSCIRQIRNIWERLKISQFHNYLKQIQLDSCHLWIQCFKQCFFCATSYNWVGKFVKTSSFFVIVYQRGVNKKFKIYIDTLVNTNKLSSFMSLKHEFSLLGLFSI